MSYLNPTSGVQTSVALTLKSSLTPGWTFMESTVDIHGAQRINPYVFIHILHLFNHKPNVLRVHKKYA